MCPVEYKAPCVVQNKNHSINNRIVPIIANAVCNLEFSRESKLACGTKLTCKYKSVVLMRVRLRTSDSVFCNTEMSLDVEYLEQNSGEKRPLKEPISSGDHQWQNSTGMRPRGPDLSLGHACCPGNTTYITSFPSSL